MSLCCSHATILDAQVTDNLDEAECFTQYLQSLDTVRAVIIQSWLCCAVLRLSPSASCWRPSVFFFACRSYRPPTS